MLPIQRLRGLSSVRQILPMPSVFRIIDDATGVLVRLALPRSVPRHKPRMASAELRRREYIRPRRKHSSTERGHRECRGQLEVRACHKDVDTAKEPANIWLRLRRSRRWRLDVRRPLYIAAGCLSVRPGVHFR